MRGFTLSMSIVAALSAALSVLLFSLIGHRKETLEQEVGTLQARLETARQGSTDLAGERDATAARAAALERELNELKARSISLEARNSQLARDIVQARELLAVREKAEQAATQEAADLRRQLVEAKAAASAAALGASAEKSAAYEARIADLEAQVNFLRQSAPGTSLEEALAKVPETLSGTVLEVGPQSAFVVLNIGSRNGAVPSLEMVLRRGSTVIARVRLTDVRESYSVAHVLPSSGRVPIRAGDSATRS